MRVNLICTDFFRWATEGIRKIFCLYEPTDIRNESVTVLKGKRKAGVLDSIFASEAMSLPQVRPRY